VWTVSYFQGERDTIISIQNYRLIGVSSDSLKIQTDTSQREVSIYLLKELSRHSSGDRRFLPIFIGSALGLSIGLLITFNDKPQDPVESRVNTPEMFALMGGGLGLLKSIDEETTRYKFPFGLSNPEKREIIENILDGEKKIR